MSRYYGEMTDAINDLAENLQADLMCSIHGKSNAGIAFPDYPVALQQAMNYLANELERLSPLAVLIDEYMLDEAPLAEVMWCYRKVRQQSSDASQPLSANHC
jgi:hypothetical protein